MKRLKSIFAILAVAVLGTALMSASANAQTPVHYTFNKSFNVSSGTANLALIDVAGNWDLYTPGSVSPIPCNGGNFLCGVDVSDNTLTEQQIIDAVRDAAASGTPYYFDGQTIVVNGVTITIYLRTTTPPPFALNLATTNLQ